MTKSQLRSPLRVFFYSTASILIYISDISDDFSSLPLIYADDTKLFEIVDEPAVSVGRLNSDLTLAEILDKMAAALAHFVHNGVQII